MSYKTRGIELKNDKPKASAADVGKLAKHLNNLSKSEAHSLRGHLSKKTGTDWKMTKCDNIWKFDEVKKPAASEKNLEGGDISLGAPEVKINVSITGEDAEKVSTALNSFINENLGPWGLAGVLLLGAITYTINTYIVAVNQKS